MKITQKRVKQIIKEEVSRAKRLLEGYTVPEFETTEDMNLFLDELEVDEEVEQDIVDPADGEVWVMAGEAIQDQDWYEDSERFVKPEEKPKDPYDLDDDWEEQDRLEREEEEREEAEREAAEEKYEATKEKIMEDAEQGGEDWAMDTMHDASGNPSMWQNDSSYNQYESPADYVRGFGQDAAMDIASGYTEYADNDDAIDLWNSLSNKEPYNTSYLSDHGNRPSKLLFKEIVADAVAGGIDRGVQKYIAEYGEWVPGEDPAKETLAAGRRRKGRVIR